MESANIKLACVATDVMGKSGRAMLDALVAGHLDPDLLATLARARLKDKREQLQQALDGRVRPHHRFLLSELLCQIDSLDETIARFDAQIERACAPFRETLAQLDEVPGLVRASVQVILSEIGTDMNRFPTAGHLCAWAGVAPGNHESAGKRLASKTRPGNRALRTALVQSAHAAVRNKNSYLSAQYYRLWARRGKKRALMAVAHSLLVIIYHMLKRNQSYQDLGADYFQRRRPEAIAKPMIKRLLKMGYTVTPPQTLSAAV